MCYSGHSEVYSRPEIILRSIQLARFLNKPCCWPEDLNGLARVGACMQKANSSSKEKSHR